MPEFLIHTNASIKKVEPINETYVIQANNLEEAENIGKEIFLKRYNIEDNTLSVNAKRFNRSFRFILSIFFMSIAISLSFANWFVGDSHTATSFKPDMIGTLYATLLYLAYVVRFKGVEETIGSIWDLITMVTSILLLASLVNILLLKKNFSFLFFEIPFNSNYFIIFGILLSWLGYRYYSSLFIIFVTFFGLLNMTTLNAAMANYGIIYVMSATLGILLYVSIEPAIIESVPYLRNSLLRSSRIIKQDFKEFNKQNNIIFEKVKNFQNKK